MKLHFGNPSGASRFSALEGLGAETASVQRISPETTYGTQPVQLRVLGPPGWNVMRRRTINGFKTGNDINGVPGWWSDGTIGQAGTWERSGPAAPGVYEEEFWVARTSADPTKQVNIGKGAVVGGVDVIFPAGSPVTYSVQTDRYVGAAQDFSQDWTIANDNLLTETKYREYAAAKLGISPSQVIIPEAIRLQLQRTAPLVAAAANTNAVALSQSIAQRVCGSGEYATLFWQKDGGGTYYLDKVGGEAVWNSLTPAQKDALKPVICHYQDETAAQLAAKAAAQQAGFASGQTDAQIRALVAGDTGVRSYTEAADMARNYLTAQGTQGAGSVTVEPGVWQSLIALFTGSPSGQTAATAQVQQTATANAAVGQSSSTVANPLGTSSGAPVTAGNPLASSGNAISNFLGIKAGNDGQVTASDVPAWVWIVGAGAAYFLFVRGR